MQNTLYYGNDLPILRDHIGSESVDLICRGILRICSDFVTMLVAVPLLIQIFACGWRHRLCKLQRGRNDMAKKRKPGGTQFHSGQQRTSQPPPNLSVNPPPAEEALTLIVRLEEIRHSRVLTLVTSPGVMLRGDVIEHTYEQLREIGHVEKIDLFLHSVGGQTEIPWRLITLIRDFCKHFAVLIPGIAHSAATHLAMGADEIVMGPLSELSPVDPARAHPLLPRLNEEKNPVLVSVQDLRHCVNFVKAQIGNDSPDALASVFAVLFQEVHPLAIGAIQQSYELSRLISCKALSTHMDAGKDKERIERIVNAFTDEFFSHDYRIGWREAQSVGLPVVQADQESWETMWSLYQHYRSYFALLQQASKESNDLLRPIVWIDSVSGRRILEQVICDEQPIGTRWLAFSWEGTDQDQPTVGLAEEG